MNLAETNLLYRQPELYDHLNAGDTDRATLLLDLITAHAPTPRRCSTSAAAPAATSPTSPPSHPACAPPASTCNQP